MSDLPLATALGVDTPPPATLDLADASRLRRAWIYSWLADLFIAPPTVATLTAWRRGDAAPILADLAADPILGSGARTIVAALAVPLDDAALTARLGIAFGRLFLGIGGPDTIAPYESAQRFDGRLYQAPVSEMTALLAAHDLSVAETLHEPADHLGVELALMAQLVTTDHPDRSAFAGRLTAWVPDFCRLCVARDASGFWAGAAEVLLAHLGEDTPDLAAPRSSIN